jgi:hypothetical protein
VLTESLFDDATERDTFVGANSFPAGLTDEETLLATLLGDIGGSGGGAYHLDDVSPPLPLLKRFSGVRRRFLTSGGRSVLSDLFHISNEVRNRTEVMIYNGTIAGSTKFSRPFKSIHLYFHFFPAGGGFHDDAGTAMAVVFQEVE